jgi:hypothetical protein
LAILAIFAFITPILAIAQPDDIEINAVYVYRNCRETGDQMYLVDYIISYNTTPAENAGEAYMCRFRNSTEVFAVKYPYPYHNDGYDRGVIAFYFDAGDAPEWEGPYNMQLMGNPFGDWPGGVPEVTENTFDLWQDDEMTITKVVLASRILALAQLLETDWGLDMVNVNDAGQLVLTSYGSAYFMAVVPYFSDVAPTALPPGTIPGSGQIIDPVIDPIDSSSDYADELETSIIGTLFDLTPLANVLGVSRGPLTALVYYGAWVFILILVCGALQTTRPLMILCIPIVIGGAFVGVPLQVTILAAFLALFYIAFTIFYKPSPT